MEENTEYKSRTVKKKEAEHLQKLGEKLAKLPIPQLKRMDLPHKLEKALIDGKSIKQNVAGRRHRQFIGALMRDVDPDPIYRALEYAMADLTEVPESVDTAKAWVEKLLADERSGVEECLDAFPGLERQKLRQLIRNTKRKKQEKKPNP